jgi:mannose-6-phosphate isomerase-like protein (cupin superfamily)
MKKICCILSALILCCSTMECLEKRVFSIRDWIEIPDGTSVAPFFNPKDCTSKLPWDLTDDFSISAGEIKHKSSIQTLPLVTQVMFVLSGKISVVLKEAEQDAPITLSAEANEAVLMKPGSIFQLLNADKEPCKVLYIVSPAYLFELDETGSVVYDDTFIVNESWSDLEQQNWKLLGLASKESLKIARDESYQRLALRKHQLQYSAK